MKFLWMLLVCALVVPAHAQTKEELVDQLLEIPVVKRMTSGAELFAPMGEFLQQQMLQDLERLDTQGKMPQEVKQEFVQYAGELFMEESTKMLRDFRPHIRGIYLETFTAEELDYMITFYQNPHAVSMMEKMPLLMQKSMQQIQPIAQSMGESIRPKLMAKLQELKRKYQ